MTWLRRTHEKRIQTLAVTSRRSRDVLLAFLVVGITLAAVNSAHAQAPQDEVVYIDTDGIGSVRLVTDTTGDVLERHDFQPFGQETPSPSGSNPLFAGKERDASGADYSGARYFAAKLGRFMGADSLTGSITDPQTLNRYVYARNNPIMFIDPDGRQIRREIEQEYDPCWALGNMGGNQEGFGGHVSVDDLQRAFDECYGVVKYPSSSPGNPVNPGGAGGGGGGGGGVVGGAVTTATVTNAPTSEESNPGAPRSARAACAADYGQAHSIASGIAAITGTPANVVTNTLFGNDIASISDIFNGRSSLANGISEFFSNPSSHNVAAFVVRGIGAVPVPGEAAANLGVNGAGTYFVKSWRIPTVAGTILGRTAGAALGYFTVGKLIWDAGTYVAGYIKCG